uniref:Glycoside hydrolase family 42 N-terminal domain-containing protein n=1 Tax=Tetradesmus obliquus TaxID=3088 RepID=A0A383VL34_TETOB|eukprot:jgi/Sobl393_1/4230/SZX65620.1
MPAGGLAARRLAPVLALIALCCLRSGYGATTAPQAAAASKKVSALDAANVLQVCSKPGQCTKIVRYPLKVRIGFECPPFAKQCTFYNTTQPASTSSRVAAAKPVNELQVFQYPKIVGSQVAMPLYQFTSEHNVLEAARRLLQSGSTSFKFDLKNQRANGKPIKELDKKGWLSIATHGELPYVTLFDMPFRHFLFWAGRTPAPGRNITWTDIDGIDVYKEMYRLVVWLLKRYNNSGKTFYIGHWEGDWCLRDTYNKSAPANPKKVQTMIKLLTDKQRAVDAAKKDNPWAKNVFVWHYAEANLVEQSMKQGPGWASMVNTVIGAVRPVIDYVSISVGGDSLREVNPAPALHKAMDFANQKLPAKPGVPGPRVFAGEFYFDMRNRDDNIAIYAPTPELQKQRGCWAAAAGVAWGAPHMLWWAFYDNEQTRSGAYRGYWLVDNGNRDTPLFRAYQQYFSDAQEFVRSVMAATGKPPSDYGFRVWATERLIQLSGKTDVPTRPAVRYWGS